MSLETDSSGRTSTILTLCPCSSAMIEKNVMTAFSVFFLTMLDSQADQPTRDSNKIYLKLKSGAGE